MSRYLQRKYKYLFWHRFNFIYPTLSWVSKGTFLGQKVDLKIKTDQFLVVSVIIACCSLSSFALICSNRVEWKKIFNFPLKGTWEPLKGATQPLLKDGDKGDKLARRIQFLHSSLDSSHFAPPHAPNPTVAKSSQQTHWGRPGGAASSFVTVHPQHFRGSLPHSKI